MNTHFIKRCIGIGLAVIAGTFLLGFVVMQLWNWLMPELFTGAHTINYWQAFGILVLSKILFGGFKGRRGCGVHHGHHWRSRFKEQWSGMSEEEREKVRKCCNPDGWKSDENK